MSDQIDDEMADVYDDYGDGYYDMDDDDPPYIDGGAASRSRSAGMPKPSEINSLVGEQRKPPDLGFEWSDEEGSYDEEEDALLYEEEYKMSRSKRARSSRRGAGGSGGGSGSGNKRLAPEVEKLISYALVAYTEKDYSTAIELAEEAVKLDNTARQALVVLGNIYEELGDSNKALLAKIMVMDLNKRDKDGWIEVARLSRDAKLYDQAVTFYSRACKLDDQDWSVRVERAKTLVEGGHNLRALDMLKKIRHSYFSVIDNVQYKKRILFDIAQILDNVGRRSEAINMYEDLYQRNKNPESYGQPDVEFGWLELNVLSELYFKERLYSKAIASIKAISRFILGRSDEAWWDEVKDDSEYDDERRELNPRFQTSPYRSDPSAYSLPVDIRARLIYCRLKLKDFNDALRHVEHVRKLDINELVDLYYSLGEALEESRLYQEALEIFTDLSGVVPGEPPLLIHIGKCYLQLLDTDQAERLYLEAINICESDEALYIKSHIEALIGLAEIYSATERTNMAKDLVDEVRQLRELLRRQEEEERNGGESTGDKPIALIVRKPRTRQMHRRPTKLERIEAEQRAERIAEEQYSKAMRHQENVERGNPIAISEWMDAASILVNMFCSIKKFFPSDRSKLFTGLKINEVRRENGDLDLDERIQRLDIRIRENELEDTADNDNSSTEEIQTHFRGISFSQWFDLFMQYALLLAQNNDIESAFAVLKNAKGANVFHAPWNTRNDEIIWLVQVSCTYLANDYATGSEITRQYLNVHQFNNDLFRLYGCLLHSGNQAVHLFNAGNNQKFFLRQVKAIDSIVQNKRIDGAAKVSDEFRQTIKSENPLLLSLYAHIMLLGKSYVPCLNYLLKSESLAPKDSNILFTMGIVHIHRAIQRQTMNRHLQIVQGFSYLMEYYEIRKQMGPCHAQEAAFNVGRSFHMLSLPTLAIKYYQEVLSIEKDVPAKYDLRKEAAYNMTLIYNLSGNALMSRKLVDQYLEI